LKGHDFSRAETAPKSTWALAPEGWVFEISRGLLKSFRQVLRRQTDAPSEHLLKRRQDLPSIPRDCLLDYPWQFPRGKHRQTIGWEKYAPAFAFVKSRVIGVLALFLSVIWMLRDEKDKTRPLLVFALILNLFFGFLLTVFMSREGGLLPWKYDHVLFALDRALGVTAAPIARSLQASFEFR